MQAVPLALSQNVGDAIDESEIALSFFFLQLSEAATPYVCMVEISRYSSSSYWSCVPPHTVRSCWGFISEPFTVHLFCQKW